MASSLFPKQSSRGNSVLDAINTMKSAAQGNPQALFNSMYQTNPQFRQFAQSMRGKTPEQAFRENGLDFEQVRGFFR